MSMNVPFVIEGAVRPAANVLTPVLTVGEAVRFGTVQINVCNWGTDGGTVRIAISKATSPENVIDLDYIEVDDVVTRGGRFSNAGVLIPGNRTVFVMSSTGDLVFRAAALCHAA